MFYLTWEIDETQVIEVIESESDDLLYVISLSKYLNVGKLKKIKKD